MRATFEPGNHIVSVSAFKCGDGLAFFQVDDQRVVVMSLAPGVFIDTNGSTELAGAPATAPFKRPAKHGARGETVAMGEFATRAPAQAFLSHAGVETLGPLDLLAEGGTRFPGPLPALGACKTSQMQPQQDGALQDREVTDAPRAALFHARTACPTLRTHEIGRASCR